MANNVDPDETAHCEPSHQDLHCLRNVLVCSLERANPFIIQMNALQCYRFLYIFRRRVPIWVCLPNSILYDIRY